MSAPAYLRALQRHDELYSWVKDLIPSDGGGSDLRTIPHWLQAQLAEAGHPVADNADSFDAFRTICSQFDLARYAFTDQLRRMPDEMQQRLQLGDTLAVGTLNSCDYNGAVFPVPGHPGARVIACPVGGLQLMQHCCVLLGLHLPILSQAVFVEAYFDALRHRQTFKDRLQRTRQQIRAGSPKLGQFDLGAVALQLHIQLHRNAVLGVADINDYVRLHLPIPVFGDPARIGHPLELGACMNHFVTGFFMRHECAHVLLDHGAGPADQRIDDEFAADQLAFVLGLSQATTPEDQVAACAGAFIFLRIGGWIGALEEMPVTGKTHPPVTARTARLRVLLETCDGMHMSRQTRRAALILVDEIEQLFDTLWQHCTPLRARPPDDMNSLYATMEYAIAQGTPAIFLDQIPRWLMFGAPEKLCFQLAKLRRQLEAAAEAACDTAPAAARRRLELLMQVYNRAQQRSDSNLYDRMMRHYTA